MLVLVTACIRVMDYERACAWCDRIAEFAERYGSRYMLVFCGAGYGAVHLWRGSWEQAEQVISEHTVHRHVTNILRKLDLPSRAAAAAHAVRVGLAGEAGR